MCFSVVFVWEKNKQEKSRVSKKFNQGCLLFFEGEEDHFFESFLDPQISFARIL